MLVGFAFLLILILEFLNAVIGRSLPCRGKEPVKWILAGKVSSICFDRGRAKTRKKNASLGTSLSRFSVERSRMRRAVLWLSVVLLAGRVQGDEVPIGSLPQPVVETANQNKGSGTIQHAESYPWGNAIIYKIEIDLDGKPGLELQIADNGKLIRVDQLGEPPDEGPDPTGE
jgi:hypothetical protein